MNLFMLKKKPLLFESNNLPKSQDIKNIEKLTFGCSIMPKHLVEQKLFIFGDKPYFYKFDNKLKNIDIDQDIDFTIA
jgi:CMP-N-acetylneuraminic acid synthetase